jgi:hypothetical protein
MSTPPFSYVSRFHCVCCAEEVSNLVNRPVVCLFGTRMSGTSTKGGRSRRKAGAKLFFFSELMRVACDIHFPMCVMLAILIPAASGDDVNLHHTSALLQTLSALLICVILTNAIYAMLLQCFIPSFLHSFSFTQQHFMPPGTLHALPLFRQSRPPVPLYHCGAQVVMR